MANEENKGKKGNNLPKTEYLWSDRKRHLGLPLSFTKYAVSEDRLFVRTGFLNLSVEEIEMYRVMDIGLTRSLGQRVFGVGTIEVHSNDKTSPILYIRNVKHSEEVKELIRQKVEVAKKAHNVRSTELFGGAGTFDAGAEGDGADVIENT